MGKDISIKKSYILVSISGKNVGAAGDLPEKHGKQPLRRHFLAC
jgi:hypothetical protein